MLMPYFFLKRNSLIKQLTLNISALEIDNRYLIQKCQELEAKLTDCDYLPVPPMKLRVRVGGWVGRYRSFFRCWTQDILGFKPTP